MSSAGFELIRQGILQTVPSVGSNSISFVGSDSTHGGGVGSLALTLPPHQADDLAVIFAFGDDPAATISIGGAVGWTELVQESSTVGRTRRSAVFYKSFDGGSEVDPSVDFSRTEQWSASVHVFRGIDAVAPIDTGVASAEVINDRTPTAPDITTVTDRAAIITLHGATHSDINTAGAPAGYVLGETVLSFSHRNQFAAYLLDAGPAGLKSPGDWTHGGSGLTVDNSVYTFALRRA